MAERRIPLWAAAVVALLFAFAGITYVNTGDPTILVFAVFASGVVLVLAVLLRAPLAGLAAGGHVHCAACGREGAVGGKHCAHCGAALARAAA